ncbi:MAG: D,D-heptose 1,7-bisphosphate phosphatase [Gemmatimonadetes bacterium]|nr:D,D-heptose 1,7-bisphosphate phosphatase [Gemmatimonadota bacterium]|tara:strand:- start:6709 stop:8016 length:1308 start_codon:yes stop_codon:yes gene_type:complete
MRVVLLAGGRGTRLESREIPKPMVRIEGKPVLEHQIVLLKAHRFTQVTVLASYKAEKIEEYFGDGKEFGIDLEIVREDPPLGTAGAVKAFAKNFKDPFLVIYSDLMIDMDLTHLVEFHKSRDSLATLVVHPNDHPLDSDLVEIDEEGFVREFISKPHKTDAGKRNLVNAAVYVLDPLLLKMIPEAEPSDFGKDIFPELVKSGGRVRAYLTTEYVKDMGTPQRLAAVTRDFQTGKIGRMKRSIKRKVCFLDRDGVINQEVGDLSRVDQLVLIPGAAEAIRKLNQKGFLVIVVTNQPALAKGFMTFEGLSEIHAQLEWVLGLSGAFVDGIYVCPHHPKKGFQGEVERLKKACECRKPAPGLLLQALVDHNLDMSNSWLIGDRFCDIAAGKSGGVNSNILVQTGHAGHDEDLFEEKPDFVVESIVEACNLILERSGEE